VLYTSGPPGMPQSPNAVFCGPSFFLSRVTRGDCFETGVVVVDAACFVADIEIEAIPTSVAKRAAAD